MEYDEGKADSVGTYQVNVHELQISDVAQPSPPKSMLQPEPRQILGCLESSIGDGPSETLPGT